MHTPHMHAHTHYIPPSHMLTTLQTPSPSQTPFPASQLICPVGCHYRYVAILANASLRHCTCLQSSLPNGSLRHPHSHKTSSTCQVIRFCSRVIIQFFRLSVVQVVLDLQEYITALSSCTTLREKVSANDKTEKKKNRKTAKLPIKCNMPFCRNNK